MRDRHRSEWVNDTIEKIQTGNLPEPLEVTLLRDTLALADDLFGNPTNGPAPAR